MIFQSFVALSARRSTSKNHQIWQQKLKKNLFKRTHFWYPIRQSQVRTSPTIFGHYISGLPISPFHTEGLVLLPMSVSSGVLIVTVEVTSDSLSTSGSGLPGSFFWAWVNAGISMSPGSFTSSCKISISLSLF